ncbi:MAG TPA: acyl-CoA dehydrogenase family protein [Burkholderiaceae bacterium]|nr:acyl-CoA dehydrogenase family protein [Burkholderiaceae bacterium]
MNPSLDLAAVPAAIDQLAQALAATAIERDRAGGHAAAERERIRASGLLRLSIPQAFGGLQADWATLYGSVRRLAQVDSALAHVYAFHHLQMASVLLYGNGEQQDRLFSATVAEGLFWGNALNPLDTGLVATAEQGGWRLDGVKSYASGSVGSDRLCLSAHVKHTGAAPALLIGVLPTRCPGVTVREDWDSFGQKQTDSGTVHFDAVLLPTRDVLLAPGASQSVRATLRPQIAQLILTHLYLGIAQGAFEAARRFTLDHGRAWFTTGLARAADDPVLQHRYGQLRLLVRPAELLAEVAVAGLQRALDVGPDLGAAQRGDLAIAVAEAKVLAHRAAIEVTTQLFELTGARSTSSRYGLDRFWRNARVHTLHDPVDQKLRDIGRHALEGVWPQPTPYS